MVSAAVWAAVTFEKLAWSGEQVRRQKKCLKLWLQAGQPTRKMEAIWICRQRGWVSRQACLVSSQASIGARAKGPHLRLQFVKLLLGAAVA